jgi:hypothetical protein
MKKVIISLIMIFTLGTISVCAQCDETVRKAALQEMGDSQYIKDFSVNLKKTPNELKTGLVRFNVLLYSRNHYKFNVVNGVSNPDGIIMQLYDGDRLLGSNLDSGKMYKAFDFVCRTTKVYSLVFSFRAGEEGCAEAVLSLVKQYSEGEMGF